MPAAAAPNSPGNGQTHPRLSLHEAAAQGLTHIILQRLDEGAAIYTFDGTGSTALFLAIREGHLDAAQALLSRGADVETPSGSLRSVHAAALSLSPAMMATVLRHRPDLEARSNGLTALFYAILAGDEGVVRLLLEAGAEATARTLCVPGTGESVVHMAVGSWRHAMLPLLIALGADVNVRGTNPAGQTALHITAEQGNEEALRALIEAGVDVFAKYADGRTALDVAAKEGRVGTASMLLDRGVNVAGYEDGRTSPMYLAAVHNREELVRFLLGRCGSAMSEEERIHVVNGAAGAGRLEILKLLHAKGFPVIGRDERGDSGLTLAAYFGHKDAAVYLLRQGADIQGRDVQVAGWSRNPGVLELLQEAERQRAAVPDAELFPGWKDSPERFDPSSELSRQAEFFWTPAFSVKATRWIHVNQAPAGSFRCLVCRDLDFRRGMPADAEVAYFIAVELMGTAASGGCRGCRFLSDCLAQARRAYGEGEWGYDSMTHITLHSMALGAPLLLHGRGGDHTSWPSRRVEIYVEEGTGTTWPAVGTGRDVSLPGWPAERAELARKFVRDCIANHSHCSYQEGPLPTRVIRVGSASEEPRLHISNGEHAKYATLSHCWGGVSPLTTTTSTLAQRMWMIGFDELPRTFQDAVTITRSLGVAYLWIDSLCILQDDAEDWRKEAAKTKDVYANCYDMISADDSINPHGGCFTAAADASRASHAVNSLGPWFSKARAFIRLTHLRDPFHGEVCHRIGDPAAPRELSRSVLNQRGWCLQERVLAPAGPALWTVRAGVGMPDNSRLRVPGADCSQLGQESRFKALFADQLLRGRSQSDPGGSGASGQVDILLWMHFLEEFTRRTLTRNSDMLHAVSGLARYMAAATGADYFCGIWRTQLAEFLLWTVNYSVKSPVALALFSPLPFRLSTLSPAAAGVPTRPRRHKSYHAPSWCWASVIAPIRFLIGRLDTSDKDQISHIRKDGALEKTRNGRIPLLGSAEVECAGDPLDPFGPPRHASMTVSGPTVPVTWARKQKSTEADCFRLFKHGGSLVYQPPCVPSSSTSPTATPPMAADFEPDFVDEDLDVHIGDPLLLLFVVKDLEATLVKKEANVRSGQNGTQLEGLVLAPAATTGGQTAYRRVGIFEATGQGWQEVATTQTITIV